MNERIKEIAEQARAEVRADWDKGNKIPYPEAHYQFQNDNDQKFAELIIQECGVALHPMMRDMISRGQAHKLIKEHFGLEE